MAEKARRSVKASKDSLAQVIVKVDRQEYRRLRLRLMEGGRTVSSWFRENMKRELSR